MSTESGLQGILRTLGLAKRAGKLICGVPLVCDSLKKKDKPVLTVLAGKASDNSQKRISDKCAYYDVKLLVLPCSPEELGHAVGSSGSVAALALIDAGLASLVRSQFEKSIEP